MKDSLTDVSWARRVGQDTGGRPADGPPKAGLAVSGSLTSIALAPADPGPAPRVAWKRCRGRRPAVGPVSRSAGQPVSRSVGQSRTCGSPSGSICTSGDTIVGVPSGAPAAAVPATALGASGARPPPVGSEKFAYVADDNRWRM